MSAFGGKADMTIGTIFGGKADMRRREPPSVVGKAKDDLHKCTFL
jgi:hypothetical protein